jgi:hypothetical protein
VELGRGGHAIAQAASHRLHTVRPEFEPRSGHVGFVVDKVALGQFFSKHFGFPCQFSFHRLLHTHHLSRRIGIIGQIVADVPSGHSLTPPQETKKNPPCGFPSEPCCLTITQGREREGRFLLTCCCSATSDCRI